MQRTSPDSSPPAAAASSTRRRDVRHRHRLRIALAASALAALAVLSFVACGSLGYGAQALAGGASILARREPVERALRRGDLPADERTRLELAQTLRRFAIEELKLPDNRSYTSYVRLGRESVAWNVIAAPELSVEPRTWCFPVAGCVSYRGYFREERAQRFAAKLAARGDDVTVRGVAAYSTLGWFADPLTDAFLADEPWRVAGLLFHELAHQAVYAPDDTAFNESFASLVEEAGVARWAATLDPVAARATLDAIERDRREEELYRTELLAARAELERVYASNASRDEKLAAKRVRLAALGARIDAALERGELSERWTGLRGRAWNNADLAATADYTLWLPALRELFARSGGFTAFLDAARALAERSHDERQRALAALDPPATE